LKGDHTTGPRRSKTPRGAGGLRPHGRWSAGFEFARQVALVGLGVFVYFRVRGLTEGAVGTANENGLRVLAFEQRLGIDIEERAQALILGDDRLVTFANWVYIWGHWPVIIVVLGWLFVSHRPDYLLLRNAMFISGGIGLVIFATFAVAPPRLLGVGLHDTVSTRSTAYRALQPPALVNQYAAMPSLHVGWNLLVGIAVFRATRHVLLKALAVVGPFLMTVGVVLTGNHYVVDCVLGAMLALFGLAMSALLTPRLVALDHRTRQRLHQGGVVEDQPVDPPGDQASGDRFVVHRPAEDAPVPPPESGHELPVEQPAVDGDPVQRDGRRKAAQQEQLKSVPRRADDPGPRAAAGAGQHPPRLA
jgi:membrane-associated phospholipid phosphatase